LQWEIAKEVVPFGRKSKLEKLEKDPQGPSKAKIRATTGAKSSPKTP